MPALLAAAHVVCLVLGVAGLSWRCQDSTAAPPGEANAGRSSSLLAATSRAKGGPRLVAYRKQGDGAERLRNGTRAHELDLVQLGYVAAGRPFGAIISLDGVGVVTVHHPSWAEEEPQLAGPGTRYLAFSFELDDAPGYERFFLVTAWEPFSLELVLTAAHQLAADPLRGLFEPLPLPTRFEQTAFTLLKDRL